MKRYIHILLVALAAIVGSAPAIMAEPAVEKAVTEKLEETVAAAEEEKPDLKETIFEHLGDAYGIKEGNAANFVVFDAKNWYDALNYDVSVLYSYRNGKLVAETKPKETTVHY